MNKNEITEISKKTNEISDINNSQDYQYREANPNKITNDLLPEVRKKYIIFKIIYYIHIYFNHRL